MLLSIDSMGNRGNESYDCRMDITILGYRSVYYYYCTSNEKDPKNAKELNQIIFFIHLKQTYAIFLLL